VIYYIDLLGLFDLKTSPVYREKHAKIDLSSLHWAKGEVQ